MYLTTAYREHAISELRRLRESSPDPSLVSTLDLAEPGPDGDRASHLEVIQPLLDSFKRAFIGPRPSKRQRDNAGQKLTRARKFFCHCLDKGGPQFLNSLVLAEEVAPWVGQLLAQGLAVTTARHYLMDLSLFADHALHSPGRPPCLTEATLRQLARACPAQVKMLRADLLVHRTDARDRMSRCIVERKLLFTYLKKARKRIPKALQELRRSRDYRSVQLAQGMIAGYLCILSGHRRGVLTNMRTREFDRVTTTRDGYRVVAVRDHKTASYFGRAKVALSPAEHGWIKDLINLRGIESEWCFCSPEGGQCRALLSQFRAAWRTMGFVGRVSFGHLRSSLVTHVRDALCTRSIPIPLL